MFFGGQCARAYISTWTADHFPLKVSTPSLPVPGLLKSEPRFFFFSPVFPFYEINLSSSIKQDANRNDLYFSFIVRDKQEKMSKASSCSNSVFSKYPCLCLKNLAWLWERFIKLRSGVEGLTSLIVTNVCNSTKMSFSSPVYHVNWRQTGCRALGSVVCIRKRCRFFIYACSK